jgi:hypothetical protein
VSQHCRSDTTIANSNRVTQVSRYALITQPVDQAIQTLPADQSTLLESMEDVTRQYQAVDALDDEARDLIALHELDGLPLIEVATLPDSDHERHGRSPMAARMYGGNSCISFGQLTATVAVSRRADPRCSDFQAQMSARPEMLGHALSQVDESRERSVHFLILPSDARRCSCALAIRSWSQRGRCDAGGCLSTADLDEQGGRYRLSRSYRETHALLLAEFWIPILVEERRRHTFLLDEAPLSEHTGDSRRHRSLDAANARRDGDRRQGVASSAGPTAASRT